ncbi:hypothetical protein JCM8208_002454 [Rhodotorula glutinis]
MPLARLTNEPEPAPAPPPADPRLARARTATASREPKTEECSSPASVASFDSTAGPHRSSVRSDRSATTPYSKSHSFKPADSPAPASMYARDDSGLVYCGTCLRFLPPRTFTSRQLSNADRSYRRAIRDRHDLELRHFAKCVECTVPQAVDLKCGACGVGRPASFFSEAMRANPYGATCRACQSVATDVKDLVPRAECVLGLFLALEADPFDALSSDEDLDLADNLTSRSSTHGGSARSGPLDGPARATVKADLNGTYGAGARAGREFGLEKDENEDEKPSGPRPAVVYDDDDDEW